MKPGMTQRFVQSMTRVDGSNASGASEMAVTRPSLTPTWRIAGGLSRPSKTRPFVRIVSKRAATDPMLHQSARPAADDDRRGQLRGQVRLCRTDGITERR